MNSIPVETDEFYKQVFNINLIKLRLNSDTLYSIVPVLYVSENYIEILFDIEKSKWFPKAKDSIEISFKKHGYEYLAKGEVTDLSLSSYLIVKIECHDIQKFKNMRRFSRFNVELDAYVYYNDLRYPSNKVKNLSVGGVLFESENKYEQGELIEIEIQLKSGKKFSALSKIMRCDKNKDIYVYGIQFIKYSNEDNIIISKEITSYEKEYFDSLNILKDYNKEESEETDICLTVLSYDIDESYEIREIFYKIGINNYDVIHNFKFFYEYFENENPSIVIIDSNILDSEVSKIGKLVKKNFPDKRVLLILPQETKNEINSIKLMEENIDVYYKSGDLGEFQKYILDYIS